MGMPNSKSIEQLGYVLKLLAILTSLILVMLYVGLELVVPNKPYSEFLKSLSINVISVLIAYLVIAYVLDKRGLSPTKLFQQELSNSIINQFPLTKDYLTQSESNHLFDMGSKLHESTEFYLIGYSFVRVVDRLRLEFIKAAKNGTKIKIIVVEPKSEASSLLKGNQIKGYDIDNDLERILQICSSVREALNLEENSIGNFEIRFINNVPSFSVFISNPNSEAGVMRILHYPLTISHYHPDKAMYKVIRRENEANAFLEIVNNFEDLWSSAKTEKEVREKLSNLNSPNTASTPLS